MKRPKINEKEAGVGPLFYPRDLSAVHRSKQQACRPLVQDFESRIERLHSQYYFLKEEIEIKWKEIQNRFRKRIKVFYSSFSN